MMRQRSSLRIPSGSLRLRIGQTYVAMAYNLSSLGVYRSELDVRWFVKLNLSLDSMNFLQFIVAS